MLEIVVKISNRKACIIPTIKFQKLNGQLPTTLRKIQLVLLNKTREVKFSFLVSLLHENLHEHWTTAISSHFSRIIYSEFGKLAFSHTWEGSKDRIDIELSDVKRNFTYRNVKSRITEDLACTQLYQMQKDVLIVKMKWAIRFYTKPVVKNTYQRGRVVLG